MPVGNGLPNYLHRTHLILSGIMLCYCVVYTSILKLPCFCHGGIMVRMNLASETGSIWLAGIFY
ncbi:MAG: hypothetical protein WAT53_06270 [Nitrosomonas sp.]